MTKQLKIYVIRLHLKNVSEKMLEPCHSEFSHLSETISLLLEKSLFLETLPQFNYCQRDGTFFAQHLPWAS